MTGLNEDAKLSLREAGVSQAAWARTYFADGRWHGDACGCPDDRCIGYHHDGPNDCGCLPALLAERVKVAQRAASGNQWDDDFATDDEASGTAPGRPVSGAELAARITAATAVLGDYRSDATRHAFDAPWQSWAYRLASMLGAVLDGQPAESTGLEPAESTGLEPDQLEVLGQALGDAVTYRDPSGACPDCDASPANLCADHAADLDKTDAYLQLAAALGIEVER